MAGERVAVHTPSQLANETIGRLCASQRKRKQSARRRDEEKLAVCARLACTWKTLKYSYETRRRKTFWCQTPPARARGARRTSDKSRLCHEKKNRAPTKPARQTTSNRETKPTARSGGACSRYVEVRSMPCPTEATTTAANDSTDGRRPTLSRPLTEASRRASGLAASTYALRKRFRCLSVGYFLRKSASNPAHSQK